MKLKRMLACILTLLLAVSLLPIGAMADTIPDLGEGESTELISSGQYMQTNSGLVAENFGEVNTNKGEVRSNSGEVTINFGTIDTNEAGGNVGDCEYDADLGCYFIDLSGGNFGTITTNEGTVSQNGGLLSLPDGKGHYTKDQYTGTIGTNAQGGIVALNSEGSTIGENFGFVETNEGTLTNKDCGEVEVNRGTIINEEGGTLYEYVFGDNWEDPAPVSSNAITAAGTYYGILIDKGWLHEDTDTYTWTYDSALLQKQNNEKIDLTTLFEQDGYQVTSYYEKVDGDYVEGTSTTYTVSGSPSYLYLIWEKIQAVISSSNEPEVMAAAVPTTVAAEDVKVGTVILAKDLLFRVIEMDDNSITVVTIGNLSKKDLEDPMAFLANYLTAQQLQLLQGSPEQISDELAAQLFGGNPYHIVFKAAKNLFA